MKLFPDPVHCPYKGGVRTEKVAVPPSGSATVKLTGMATSSVVLNMDGLTEGSSSTSVTDILILCSSLVFPSSVARTHTSYKLFASPSLGNSKLGAVTNERWPDCGSILNKFGSCPPEIE